MEELIYKFPEQIQSAITIAEKVDFSVLHYHKIHNVVVCGLGGSAMGADIVRKYACKMGKVPIIVNRHYNIPSFIDEHSLVILSSYSGNTEETLSAAEFALSQKAVILAISSGGRLQEFAQNNSLLHIPLPGGYPPRAALAFSTIQQLYVLRELKLIKKGFKKELEESIQLLTQVREEFRQPTSGPAKLAQFLKDKIPVIYASEELEAVAIRMRQQINENAKQLCWHHIFPEMNHNELVGWRFPDHLTKHIAVLILHCSFDHIRVQARYDICKPIFKKYTQEVYDIMAQGKSMLAQVFYLIHFSDWLSYFLAKENKIEPTPVEVIDYLKSSLEKL
ncbi:MAG: bifunctional phosphoglucose/phosphomannose isomerase [Bacteroidia bacterium]|nr:bifunctional phosphoglucose/phosphomannose isomerase [Bacteroidia bacterium]MDW8346119.1 bifunctional phosphoglucose/phosphomannose isomerase [Bacteroidia bacterium]